MPSDDQRIANLERALGALAGDVARELYGHRGSVEWDDEQGWLMVDRAGDKTFDAERRA